MFNRLLVIFITAFIFLHPLNGSGQIYVSTNGHDSASGSKGQPKASLQSALRKAREMRRLNDPAAVKGISIIIGDGTYYLNETIAIRPEDAGTEISPTRISTEAGEKAIISGGLPLANWKKLNTNIPGLPAKAKGNLWVTDIPSGKNFRQFWVNDHKAVRAKDINGAAMNRILSWNKKEQSCWIPTPAANLQNVKGLEMFIHQWWAIAILRIKTYEVHGDSTKLAFYQPESRIQSEHPWPAPWVSKESGNSAFYLMNAIQLLDEPGEWFADNNNGKLYYWPLPGEYMQTANAVVSGLETLISIEGTPESPVKNIYLDNISFQHTSFERPGKMGHVALQDGMFFLDAYKLKIPGTALDPDLENQAWVGRPPAAVELSNAENIIINNCSFLHLASTALDFNKGTHNAAVKGSLFKDIGGNGILAGTFSDEAMEAHLPYNPVDKRAVCTNINISNNLLSGIANEDWGCVGIAAGYTQQTNIEHNDLSNLSYMGISMGWGWTAEPNVMKENKVRANKISHYARNMHDVAAIYTLSSQPGSVISENYIDSIYKAPYAHDPNHWFYLYTDQGTSFMTIKDNWCPSGKFLQNAVGPGNVWTNNGPEVDASIKTNAGLQREFRYLLKEKLPAANDRLINKEQFVVLELVMTNSNAIDTGKLNEVLRKSSVSINSVYHWQNHFVIFDKITDLLLLQGRLRNAFPAAELKTFAEPFYDFNRNYCDDKSVSKEWDHILLTANLVSDKKLQQEYMDYHATQFEKWPDIARGFCNAGFQQLLVYRNGRQLMLVISIPKGESLDKLNPKTTENNPKMDEWNAIMKKYQEGIAGTKPGTTWVFMEKL